MNGRALLIMLLAASVFALGQAAPSNSASSTQPAQTIVVPGTGVPGAVAGPSTNTGTAVIIAPPSSPLMVTPEVHLTTVQPNVGASNATAGNTAGAANATASMPVNPRVVTTVPQFAVAEATVMTTPAPEQTPGVAPATMNTGVGSAANAPGAPAGIGNNGSRSARIDRGVGAGTALVSGGHPEMKSLGELARENRQHEAAANARVYTNQDIQRINEQPGLQVGGMTGVAVGAGNAAGTPQQPSNAPAVSQPSNTPNPSQPVPPATNAPPQDQSQATPPSPLGQTQAPGHANGGAEIAQATVPPNPAGQNTPASPADKGRREQLPAGSSVLPLMAVVGVLATGAGLLAK